MESKLLYQVICPKRGVNLAPVESVENLIEVSLPAHDRLLGERLLGFEPFLVTPIPSTSVGVNLSNQCCKLISYEIASYGDLLILWHGHS